MKNFKKIVAIVAAIALLASFATLFSVSAAVENVALNATVTSSNARASGEISNLTDGQNSYSSEIIAYLCNTNQYASYEVNFGSAKEINKVRLCYYNAEAYKRCRDIAIDAKVDGQWKRVSAIYFDGTTDIFALSGGLNSATNSSPITKVDFYFEPVNATAIRVSGSNAGIRQILGGTGTYNFMLTEIEAYNDPSVTTYTEGTTVRTDIAVTTHIGVQTSTTVQMPTVSTGSSSGSGSGSGSGSSSGSGSGSGTPPTANDPVCVSTGATVTSSNTKASGEISNLTDGQNSYSSSLVAYLCDTEQYASYEVDFGSAKEINKVRLCYYNAEAYKRCRDIAIDAKVDGQWKRVSAIYFDGTTDIFALSGGLNSETNTTPITKVDFYFEPVNATAIRVSGSNAGIRQIFGGTGTYNFMLTEIEAWNDPSVTTYTEGTTVRTDIGVTTHIGVQTSSTVKMPTISTGSSSGSGSGSSSGSSSGSGTSLPKTGDNTNAVAVMVALVAAGFVCFAALKARKA